MEAQKLQDSTLNAEVLRFGSMLREPRDFVSDFERDVAHSLVKAGLAYEYEPYKFFVEIDGRVRMFVPDFRITNAKMGGKEIILEPHGAAFTDDYFFKKLNAFMDSKEHDSRYFVLITNMSKEEMTRRLAKLGMKLSDIADDIWFETSTDGTVAGYLPYLERKTQELADKARALSNFMRRSIER